MPKLVTAVTSAGALGGREQPVLDGVGLLLRPWEPSDVAVLVDAYSDPEIQRWHARTMTASEAQDWVATRSVRWTTEIGAEWAVTRDQVVVGRIGLRTLDLSEGSGEVAYWVLPGARGRGVASRALAALTDWAFAEVGLHRAVLKHSTRNPASCAVAERVGYQLEGTARSEVLHQDGWHDMHWHARLA
ncbi:GNAT family N-acetyltransferase [Nakamurella sp. A5-74]|uniref:GNAT family N-acetyltransferase n=1 Tax=Nakamurella sp. A5-74 TaxID=3158264 RepID=A0AAU8DS92_9ACTN